MKPIPGRLYVISGEGDSWKKCLEANENASLFEACGWENNSKVLREVTVSEIKTRMAIIRMELKCLDKDLEAY